MRSKLINSLDVSIEYLIYALIFYIPISIAFVSVIIIIALSLFLIKQFLSTDFSSLKPNKIFFFLFVLFFICMALSLINSGPYMAKSLKAILLKWGRFLLVVWMILETFRNSRRIVIAASVFFFSAALVGFSALSQKFFSFEFLRHHVLDAGGVTGSFGSRIDLASYLTCVIPIALSFGLWKFKSVFFRISCLVITAFLILASLFTYCRGGWIALFVGFVLFTLLINYHRLSKKVFWTLCSIGYILFLPLIAVVLFLSKEDPERILLYRGAWKMIVEHPFLGKGIGTFMDYCALYTNYPWVCYAHNCFLQIWAESGIFSLLAFLALNGYVFYKTTKVILKMPVSLNFYILTGLFTGYFGLLVHCFFDTQLYSFQLSFLFWVVMGLTLALGNIEGKKLLN